MPKYRIDGVIYEADTPEQAYDLAMANPTAGMSTGERFLAGIGQGMTNVGRQVGNIFGLVSNEELAEAAKTDEALLATDAGQWGSLAGELALTAPVAGGIVGTGAKVLTRALPAAGRAGGLVSGATRGAAEGALEGAVLAGPDNRLAGAIEGAKWGGGTGGAVGAVPDAVRYASQPARRSDDAAQIAELGRRTGTDINMTVGQEVSPENLTGAMVKGVEENLQRIPGAHPTQRAREAAMANWNLAEVRDALPDDLAQRITTPGPEGMAQVRRVFREGYDEALEPLRRGDVTLDDFVLDDLVELEATINRRIPEASVDAVKKDVDNLMDDLLNNRIDADNVKNWEKKLRAKMRTHELAGDLDQAQVYEDLREILRAQRDAAVGPENAARLRQLDAAYSQIAPIREAASMKGAVREGFFTPSQLLSGGQKGQGSWGKASASSPASRRAIQADEVFGETVPRVGPGTAEKLAAQAIVGGLAGAGMGVAAGEGVDAGNALAGAFAAPVLARSLGSRRAKDIILGNTRGQAAMRRGQRPLEQTLNRLVGPAARRGAAAYGVQQEYNQE